MMETLPGMPIKVGKITRPMSSSIDSTYHNILTPEDESRAYSMHVLSEGESRLVVESSWIIPIPFPFLIPRRITNVNGRLVKTFMRRPRVTT